MSAKSRLTKLERNTRQDDTIVMLSWPGTPEHEREVETARKRGDTVITLRWPEDVERALGDAHD